MKPKTYVCPVCGYPQLEDPPSRYEICPCCQTQFENDDEFSTRKALRDEWIGKGMKFWATWELPNNFAPNKQLHDLLWNNTVAAWVMPKRNRLLKYIIRHLWPELSEALDEQARLDLFLSITKNSQ